MQTGCQGPFVNGTGGFCGCDCKCCPPTCCKIISVFFQCGADFSMDNPDGCKFSMSLLSLTEDPLLAECGPFPNLEAPISLIWADLVSHIPIPELPKFHTEPILSEGGQFRLGGGSVPCTVPCKNICVEVTCGGGPTPCCCLQLTDGKIISVGNGYVTAPTTVPIDNDCTEGTVFLNGMAPPIFVNDGQQITVTVTPQDTDCCECQQTDIQCAPCPMSMGFASKGFPLWKRKTDSRTGKIKINPKTGLPIIVINKAELKRRILERTSSSRRRRK